MAHRMMKPINKELKEEKVENSKEKEVDINLHEENSNSANLEEIIAKHKANKSDSRSDSSVSRKVIKSLFIIVIGILVLLIAGKLISDGNDNEDLNGTDIKTESVDIKKPDKKANNKQSEVLQKAQHEAEQYGFSGIVSATSYGNNEDGFLIVDKSEGTKLLVIDRKNHRASIAEPKEKLASFTNNTTRNEKRYMLVNFIIPNDDHDKDRDLGIWKEKNHAIPIYGEYTLNDAGNVVPGKLTSKKGINGNNYTEWLHEQKNVDMMNLFLTELTSLLNNAKENGVKLE